MSGVFVNIGVDMARAPDRHVEARGDVTPIGPRIAIISEVIPPQPRAVIPCPHCYRGGSAQRVYGKAGTPPRCRVCGGSKVILIND